MWISVNNLKEILRDFKSKLIDKNTFDATKTDLEEKINNIDTSNFMGKAIYDTDNDGIVDEASNIKIAFSIDDGLTWKTYNEDTAAFEDMQITIPVDKKYSEFDEADLLNWNNAKDTIYSNGIDVSALNVIDFNVLDMKRVKFAYVLSASNVDDMSKMKQLLWQFDAHGYVELCDKSDVNIQIANSGIQLKSNIDADMLKVNIAWNSQSDNNAFYF